MFVKHIACFFLYYLSMRIVMFETSEIRTRKRSAKNKNREHIVDDKIDQQFVPMIIYIRFKKFKFCETQSERSVEV